jgi:hypothetical protein
MFNLFKKRTKPANFFNFPHNSEGVAQVITWLKQASELVLDLNADRQLTPYEKDGEVFLKVYTHLAQHVPPLKKNDLITTATFADLVELLKIHPEVAFIWLNPGTDNVRINRSVFTTEYSVSVDTPVTLGQPAEVPEALVSLLKEAARTHATLHHVYFALMEMRGQMSYLVTLDCPDPKAIMKTLGPQIDALEDQHQLAFPVDFINDDMIVDDDYLLV